MRNFFKKLFGITKLEKELSDLKRNCDDFIFGKSYLILRLLTANINYVICRKVVMSKNLSNGCLNDLQECINKSIFYSPILEPISDEYPCLWTKERWKQEGYVLWGEKYPYSVFVKENDIFKTKNAFLNQEEFFI